MPPLAYPAPHQQDAHSHHGRSPRGHGAVHEDDVVLADLLGQAQVVELGREGGWLVTCQWCMAVC